MTSFSSLGLDIWPQKCRMRWGMVSFFACAPSSFYWRQRELSEASCVTAWGGEMPDLSVVIQLCPRMAPALRRTLRMACIVFLGLCSSTLQFFPWLMTPFSPCSMKDSQDGVQDLLSSVLIYNPDLSIADDPLWSLPVVQSLNTYGFSISVC